MKRAFKLTWILVILAGPSLVGVGSERPLEAEVQRAQSRGPQKGGLFIHGGGGGEGKSSYSGFVDFVRAVTAVEAPIIVVITTAGGKGAAGKREVGSARAFRSVVGKDKVKVLHTLSRKVANSDQFTAPIDAADAVWMNGGEQARLADTFLGTRTEKSFRALLARGGVIGGSSAGAQIQSSFMTRGIVRGDRILGDGKHQQGFAFMTNSAFDVHVAARQRKKDLFKLFATERGALTDPKLDPDELLGLGMDEGTAIMVRGDQFEVVGAGHVYVFDPREWKNGSKPFFHTLSAGDRYDVRKRTKLPSLNEDKGRD